MEKDFQDPGKEHFFISVFIRLAVCTISGVILSILVGLLMSLPILYFLNINSDKVLETIYSQYHMYFLLWVGIYGGLMVSLLSPLYDRKGKEQNLINISFYFGVIIYVIATVIYESNIIQEVSNLNLINKDNYILNNLFDKLFSLNIYIGIASCFFYYNRVPKGSIGM